MNLLLSWLLASVIIIIISAVVMGIVMLLYWYYSIRKVIRNVPKDMPEQIKEELKKQKEVENEREQFRRERQRRTGASETSGHSGESRQFIQQRSSNKISEIRGVNSDSISRTNRNESRDGKTKEGGKSTANEHGRITQI